nr:uncharacterized protein LOC129163738 [Nothobranchius furzeri]
MCLTQWGEDAGLSLTTERDIWENQAGLSTIIKENFGENDEISLSLEEKEEMSPTDEELEEIDSDTSVFLEEELIQGDTCALQRVLSRRAGAVIEIGVGRWWCGGRSATPSVGDSPARLGVTGAGCSGVGSVMLSAPPFGGWHPRRKVLGFGWSLSATINSPFGRWCSHSRVRSLKPDSCFSVSSARDRRARIDGSVLPSYFSVSWGVLQSNCPAGQQRA